MFRFTWLRDWRDSIKDQAGVLGRGRRCTDGIAVVMEPVEQRTLLSWPAAPFLDGQYEGTIYVNQNGGAILTEKQLKPGREFHGYETYFDDGGNLSFQTFGRMATDIAYYGERGQPTNVNARPGKKGSGRIDVNVPADKGTLYLGVKAHRGKPTGTYSLVVRGAPASYVEKIPISSGDNAGSSGSNISGTNDYDFYRFTTTHAGNWIIGVIPDRPSGQNHESLDTTMNIFDSRGYPVAGGGSFSSVIDDRGTGGTERWMGAGLPANEMYYIRVDGKGDSTGGYGVSVVGIEKPTVEITASTVMIPQGVSKATRIYISRSAGDWSDFPLPVSYNIAGTARNGIDYGILSGSATIPAHRNAVAIFLDPIPRGYKQRYQTVTLTLGPSAAYLTGSSRSVTITLVGKAAR